MKHKHHIVPKHMGGTDDPSNLVYLTIEEHAEAHKNLWETYGKIEDKVAYLGLLNMIDREEIIPILVSKPKSEEHKRKISEAHKGKPKPWLIGSKHAAGKRGPNAREHNRKISEAKRGVKRAPFSEEWKQALKESKQKQHIRICPHCGLHGKGPNMTRYHFDNCKGKRS
jgi:hypothetical protein